MVVKDTGSITPESLTCLPVVLVHPPEHLSLMSSLSPSTNEIISHSLKAEKLFIIQCTLKKLKVNKTKSRCCVPSMSSQLFGLWRRCSEERRAHSWSRSVRTAHVLIIFLSLIFSHLCRDLVANSGVPQVSGEGWRDGERERKQDLTAQA